MAGIWGSSQSQTARVSARAASVAFPVSTSEAEASACVIHHQPPAPLGEKVSVQPGGTTTFSVEVVNPNDQGGHVFEDIGEARVRTVEQVRQLLEEKLSKYIPSGHELKFGYILPGHGVRGKQRSLEKDEDVQVMYREYNTKSNVILWMKSVSRAKRKQDCPGDATKAKRSSYNSHIDKMSAVDEIVDKLKSTHKKMYTPEQLHAWGHLIQMGKHSSYDNPPDKPFFGKSRKKSTESAEVGISPGKRIGLRSECIDQLDKWHRLRERGVISPEEYADMQKTILTDIKKF